jgi:hypothetical protein
LVEQSIEAALVVSSSLILGIKSINGCAGIGRQVPFRPEWLQNCASSSLVTHMLEYINIDKKKFFFALAT